MPVPPKVREDEAAEPDGLAAQDDALADEAEVPSGEPGEGQPGPAAAAIGAPAWSDIQAALMLLPCGGRIGLFGDTWPG